MDKLEVRVAVLEEKQVALEKQQGRMWKKLESMDQHLSAIQKTLSKLLYIGTGMIVLYVAQSVGLAEVLKKMIL